MPALDTAELIRSLRDSRAGWIARETPQSLLSDDDKKALLGVVVTPEDRALAAAPPAQAAPRTPAAFAPAVDWRNRNGNHVTTVKDQMYCGSCVSFCCTAVVESMASIEHGQ